MEPEAKVTYDVKVLLERLEVHVEQGFDELRAYMKRLERALEDYVTLRVFSALRADHESAVARIATLERAQDLRGAQWKAVLGIVGKVVAFGGWIVALAVAIYLHYH